MISFAKFRELYDIENLRRIPTGGKTRVFKAKRIVAYNEGSSSRDEALIKYIPEIRFRTRSYADFAEDFNKITNLILAATASQSYLVSKLEAFTLFPREAAKTGDLLDFELIMGQEVYGSSLADDISKGQRWSEDNIDQFTQFLIRLLRFLQHKALIHTDIKPQGLARDEQYRFKLVSREDIGFFGWNAFKSEKPWTSLYASQDIIQKSLNERYITNEEWRAQEQYSAAMTLLQLALMASNDDMQAIRRQPNLYSTLDRIRAAYPRKGDKIAKTIEMLLNGTNVNDIAVFYERDDAEIYLSSEKFEDIRDSPEPKRFSPEKQENLRPQVTDYLNNLARRASQTTENIQRLSVSAFNVQSASNENFQPEGPLTEFKFMLKSNVQQSIDDVLSQIQKAKQSRNPKDVILEIERTPENIDDIMERIATSLSEVRGIVKLKIKNFGNTSYACCNTYGRIISSAPNLDSLDVSFRLRRDQSSDIEDIKKFERCISNQRNLKHLSIEIPALSGIFYDELGEGIEYLKQLQAVDFKFVNLIRTDFFETVLNSLKGLPLLRKIYIDCSSSWLKNRQVNKFSEFLKSSKNLNDLAIDLNDCDKITDESVKRLIRSIGSIQNLKNLKLALQSCNLLSNYSTKAISDIIKLNPQLESLGIGLGRIDDKSIELVAVAIINSRLVSIDLHFLECKRLTDGACQALSTAIFASKTLKKVTLNLEKCRKITNSGLQRLNELQSLKKLSEFVLTSAPFEEKSDDFNFDSD